MEMARAEKRLNFELYGHASVMNARSMGPTAAIDHLAGSDIQKFTSVQANRASL
jgi:hypothetical protein